MKKILITLCVWLSLLNVKVYATQCTGDTYGVFTCVQTTGLLVQNCGTSVGTVFSAAANTAVVVWADGTSTATIAGGGTIPTASWHVAIPDQFVFINGGNVHDQMWIGFPTSTGSFTYTINCTGSFESMPINVGSSVGTPTLMTTGDTLTTVPAFATSTNLQFTVTADATVSNASAFGISGVDWINNEPTANAPYVKVVDIGGSEHLFAIHQITTTGTESMVWSRVAGGDSYANGLVILGDGGVTGAAASGFLGPSKISGPSKAQ